MTAKVLTRARIKGVLGGPETGAGASVAFSAIRFIIAPERQKTQTRLSQELGHHGRDRSIALDQTIARLGYAKETVERICDRVEPQVIACGEDVGEIRARDAAGEVKRPSDRFDLLGIHGEMGFR